MISANNGSNREANEDERKRGRKEAKQISFRVSEDEYLKLQQSAETLDMSVPTFVKKKAQGAKLVKPKFGKEKELEMHRELKAIGTNMNQVARQCNQWPSGNAEKEELKKVKEELHQMSGELNRLWQQLN